MIPKNKKEIIEYLLRNPGLMNINQLSKRLNISVGSVFKILKEFEKKEIVNVKHLGNANYYSLNLKNPEAEKICELIFIEERRRLRGYAKIYAEEIQKFKEAKLIILFGSVLEKEKFNDVDVLFVTNKVNEVNEFCLEISKTKTKPVSSLILEKKDLIKELNNKKDSILEIIEKGVILKGDKTFLEIMKNVKD